MLAGQLQYNGTAISLLTEKEPRISVYNKETKEYYRDAVMSYDINNGSFKITNLPKSKIGVYFIFHDVGFSENLPGNYQSYNKLEQRGF